ncbi:MAG: M20/M25/M40 family metallo-hydrolase [Deltaproteobacteria bacterium]|nr:M20/M25/M40 family metallo-hydrolase [Deltaproteobacteria bacterium]
MLVALIIGIFFVVASISVYRTLLLRRPQKKLINSRETNFAIDNDAVTKLQKALKLETISDQEGLHDYTTFLHFHALLEEKFPLVHRILSREKFGKYSLLYKWPGSNGALKPMMLMSHFDVVPATKPSAWRYPPFGGVAADGYIWGRGALDVKGGIVAIMAALERLITEGWRPRRTIYIALGHDEESGGSKGNALIARALRDRGIRLHYVLDEGGLIINDFSKDIASPVALVGIAEKGYLTLALSVLGGGGHASAPPKNTATGILARALTRIEKKKFPLTLGAPIMALLAGLAPHLPFGKRLVIANAWLFAPVFKAFMARSDFMGAMLRTTVAPTMLQGSVKENVLPTQARALINVRVINGEQVASTITTIKAIINDERVLVERVGFAAEPSTISRTTSEGFLDLSTAIATVFPNAIIAPYPVFATTDSRYYEAISDDTYRFLPFAVDKSDLQGIHGIDERISQESLSLGVEFFVQLLKNGRA